MTNYKRYKYLYGSKLLGLKNPRDEDWLVLVDAPREAEINSDEKRVEFFQFIIKTFIEGKNNPEDPYKAMVLYQMSNGFFENCPSYIYKEFNILEHKNVWIKHLKNYLNLEATEQFATARPILHKTFYHFAYQYQMIINNMHFLPEEAKVDAQKIHDREMPSEYFYELRDLINSLEGGS